MRKLEKVSRILLVAAFVLSLTACQSEAAALTPDTADNTQLIKTHKRKGHWI